MKKWLKLTALTVAVLNLMMLTAALCPALFVSTGQVAFAGNDPPSGTKSIDNDQAPNLPASCDKCFHCHGFWNCLKWCAKCAYDTLTLLVK